MPVCNTFDGAKVAPFLASGRTQAPRRPRRARRRAALDLAAAALALQAPLARRGRRARRRARALHLQRVGQPGGQPVERELAVARLGAGVLRGGRDARAEARGDARLLLSDSVAEAATSNDASTREAVTFAC